MSASHSRGATAALVLVVGSLAFGAIAPPASGSALKPICGAAGIVSGLAGKACTLLQNSGRLANAGKRLLTGHIGGAINSALGGGSSVASDAVGLAALAAGALGGAKFALHETAKILSRTTSPQLRSSWFSSTYWRVAGIAAVLTLPFLFAAAVQALVRSDLALLIRAVLGYLPLAMLLVAIAAPLTSLLLTASDEMSSVVASAAGNGSGHFLDRASSTLGVLTVVSGSPFLAFFVAVLTIAGALLLWAELLAREAAVYVVVLMLPLAFAALVWPARRVWAVRTVEALAALILSKFAIVAVLSLGAAALTSSLGTGISGALAGFVLLVLGALAPWALVRLLPMAELASETAGTLRGELQTAHSRYRAVGARLDSSAKDVAASTPVEMLRELDAARSLGSDGNGAAGTRDPDSASPDRGRETQPDVTFFDHDGQDTQAGPPSVHDSLPASEAGRQESSLDPIWQAPDLSWRPLTLGLEDGWPPPGLWPPDPSEAGDSADRGRARSEPPTTPEDGGR